MTWQFAYRRHKDGDGVQCHWSLRIAPHDITIHAGLDCAACPSCGKWIPVLDLPVCNSAQPGDLVSI